MNGFIFDGDSKKDNLLSFYNVVAFRDWNFSVMLSVSVLVQFGPKCNQNQYWFRKTNISVQ
jgi:hypothetical protein